MRRRDLLAGAAALGVVGVGGALAVGGLDLRDDDRIEPIELDGIDAPGSDAGAVTVPEAGTITFVKFFATWCGTCRRMMEFLPGIYEEFGNDLQFVSVTNEPVGTTVEPDEVAEWWADHGGTWQVAHDDGLTLTDRVDASSVPYAVVFDEENRVWWADGGYKSDEEIREQLVAALEA